MSKQQFTTILSVCALGFYKSFQNPLPRQFSSSSIYILITCSIRLSPLLVKILSRNSISETWVLVYACKKYGKLDSSSFLSDMESLSDKDGNSFSFVDKFSASECAGGPDRIMVDGERICFSQFLKLRYETLRGYHKYHLYMKFFLNNQKMVLLARALMRRCTSWTFDVAVMGNEALQPQTPIRWHDQTMCCADVA